MKKHFLSQSKISQRTAIHVSGYTTLAIPL